MPSLKASTQNDWEVEDALRTITRAREIMRDQAMMKKVRALAKQKLTDMEAAVGDLDESAEKKSGKKT